MATNALGVILKSRGDPAHRIPGLLRISWEWGLLPADSRKIGSTHGSSVVVRCPWAVSQI